MIKSRTYNGQAGLNYIQSPDLAFATIYVVKREGLQHDKYISGSPNRTYSHSVTDGKVSFPTPFASPGEKVFVMFKTPTGIEPETPPGVCVPVSISPVVLPDMILGQPYSQLISISGSAPFDLALNSGIDGISITQSGGTVTVAGVPAEAGVFTVSFDLSNCAGSGNVTFSQSVTVLDNTTNFYISNLSTSGVKITKVIPKHWVIQTGSLPIHYLSGITGVHGGFTDSLSVFVTGIVFPVTLTMYKNGSSLQSFTVESDDQYTFDEQTFLSTDQIVIVLN